MDGWNEQEAWERAGQVPDGFEVNPLWEEARRLVHSSAVTAEVVLDWPTVREGPCAACGSWAYSSYRGRPVHMSCAAELAMFVELSARNVRLGAGSPAIGPGVPIPSGLAPRASARCRPSGPSRARSRPR